MITSLVCLSFLAASSEAPPIPQKIAALAKERFVQQTHQRSTTLEVRFDDPSCRHQGRYEFTHSTLKLSSENSPHWPKAREYLLSDLIEGYSLDLPSHWKAQQIPQPFLSAMQQPLEEEGSSASSRFLVAGAVGALAGGGAGYALSPNASSRSLNVLVFGLTGALVSSFLSLRW